MKNKKNERIFECTRPENVDPNLWVDCERCLYACCGYSRCFEPNPKWEEQNGICKYEHCIENMPLLMPEDARSCPIFGHECTGGVDQVTECLKQVDEVLARVERPVCRLEEIENEIERMWNSWLRTIEDIRASVYAFLEKIEGSLREVPTSTRI